MILKDGMILYHGSYAEVDEIDLGMCDKTKDFGKGFYLTTSKKQAASFIKTSLAKAKQRGLVSENQKYGYVTTYKVHLNTGIRVYEFNGASKEWLYYISVNRRHILKDKLEAMIKDDIAAYDVVVGKIANDDTNATLNAYLAGTYGDVGEDSSYEIVSTLLKPDRLENQFCFRSEGSISVLEKIGVEKYDIREN